MPPTTMLRAIKNWPNSLKVLEIITGVRPVSLKADDETNKASIYFIGSFKSDLCETFQKVIKK